MAQKSPITLTKIGDAGATIQERLRMLSKSDVLVGIPQEKNQSTEHPEIGNAALLFIHTNGSPIRNIPARPVIEPAINAEPNKSAISAELKQAAKEMLNGNPSEVLLHLKKAGMLGQNAAREWFFDPRRNWPPLKPATIRAKGSAQELIYTGSMRKAISYVVRLVR
jgi:hypothetical protein